MPPDIEKDVFLAEEVGQSRKGAVHQGTPKEQIERCISFLYQIRQLKLKTMADIKK